MIKKLRFRISNPVICDEYIRIYLNENLINEYTLIQHDILFEVPFSNNFSISCQMPHINREQNLPYLSRIETYCDERAYEFVNLLELVDLNIDQNLDIDTPIVSQPIQFQHVINTKADFKINMTAEDDRSGTLTINLLHESKTKKFIYQRHESKLIYLEPFKKGVGAVIRNYYDYNNQTESKPRYQCRIFKTISEVDYTNNEILYLQNIDGIQDYDRIFNKMLHFRHNDFIATKWQDRFLKSYKYFYENT